MPSPRQNVEELAPEPLFKLLTDRFPVTCVARFSVPLILEKAGWTHPGFVFRVSAFTHWFAEQDPTPEYALPSPASVKVPEMANCTLPTLGFDALIVMPVTVAPFWKLIVDWFEVFVPLT